MSINAITHVFEGEPLLTLEWDGKPCWVARQVGQILGYSDDGGRLVKKVLNTWGVCGKDGAPPELVEGKDFVRVAGPELEAFKVHISSLVPERSQAYRFAPELIVFFESGLNLALLKSNKPAGAKLRRFLADEVLPQLVRTGQYTPVAAPPTSDAALLARLDALEHRLTSTVTTAVASAVTAALSPLQQAMTALTHAVTALVQSHAQQPAPATAGVTTVHTNGAQIRLVQPEVPKDFTVTGLQRLADTAGCSSDKMKKRLQDVGLWGDTAWVWQGHQSVVRGDRVKQEKLYVFRKGILAELQQRESPLFPGGEAK